MKDTSKKNIIELDTSGTECPIPVLKARKLAQTINDGDIVKIIATDPLAEADFQHYCQQTGYIYLGCVKKDKKIIIRFKIKHLRK